MNYKLIILLLSLNFINMGVIQAQTTPQDLPPRESLPNPIEPRQLEQPLPTVPSSPQPNPLSPTTPTPPSSEEVLPGTISIEKFIFIGNTAFSDEELTQVTAQYVGKPIGFSQLLAAEAAVTKLYTSNGYINSGAIIPANQSISFDAAVVTIQIIEGGIEGIEISGTRGLNESYIRSRIALATKTPFNQNELLKALQLLQLDPLIESISAELSAGVRRELSLLEITIEEADSFSIGTFANNGRAPSVGSFRRGFKINEGNLTGLGDSINLAYTNTDGSDGLDLSYTIPLNPRNGTLTLTGGFSETKVIEPPFENLDLTGDSRYYEVSYRQPLAQSAREEFALGLKGTLQESETTLDGNPFPLSRGADEDGETRISALRFFQDWTKRNPREVISLRSQFNLGVSAFEATMNDGQPDSEFFSWLGQAQYVRLLAPETLFVARSDFQIAGEALVPLEQFGIGGLNSVRGYRQDALLTDNGLFATAEVRLPILKVKEVDGVLQIVPFVDVGFGWNSDNTDLEEDTLVGVGVGLNWQMGDNFRARIDYGVPLTDIDNQDRTWQENGIYFSVEGDFF